MTKKALIQENKSLKERLSQQEFIISKLQQLVFGSKSERHTTAEIPPNQLPLFEPASAVIPEEKKKETITYTRDKSAKKKRATKRIPLPEDLPRIDIVIEPEGDLSGLEKIDEEVTEILDIVPPKFQVIRIIRPKYANPLAKTQDIEKPILIAPMPERVINKGIPSTRLLAYILINKFIDHLPYYRQIQIFQRIGVPIKSNTINGWIASCCVLLKVLYDKFVDHIFSQSYLMADETTLKVLRVKKDGKKGKSHTGYYWVYLDPISNQVVFIYAAGRSQSYPVQHLRNFSGKLQTDGYAAYPAFDQLEHIELYACMAHIRRKFVEALNNDKERAEKVILLIKKLYALEDQARQENMNPAQRLQLRQDKALLIMTKLKAYLEQEYNSGKVLPKSAIGQAISYALRQWKFMERYLYDGEVEIDNNLVENAIRPVALGRKNYLFAGSEQGAKWGAMIYSLLASAIRNGHQPLEYLSDVLRRLPDTKQSQIHLLFPQNWNKNPETKLDCL